VKSVDDGKSTACHALHCRLSEEAHSRSIAEYMHLKGVDRAHLKIEYINNQKEREDFYYYRMFQDSFFYLLINLEKICYLLERIKMTFIKSFRVTRNRSQNFKSLAHNRLSQHYLVSRDEWKEAQITWDILYILYVRCCCWLSERFARQRYRQTILKWLWDVEFLVETNGLQLEHAGLRYDILVGSMLVSGLMILLETGSSGNFRDKCVCRKHELVLIIFLMKRIKFFFRHFIFDGEKFKTVHGVCGFRLYQTFVEYF